MRVSILRMLAYFSLVTAQGASHLSTAGNIQITNGLIIGNFILVILF